MITFRNANPTDTLAIAQLHAKSWQQNYRGMVSDDYLENEVEKERIAVWQKRFETMPNNRQIVLAEEGTQLIGFVCSFLHHDPVWGTLLDNLHVAKESQGKGIGKQLLKESAAWSLSQAPKSSLYLWVLEGNDQAIAFYKKIGGKKMGKKKEDFPALGKILAYRYVWEDLKNNPIK